MRVELKNIGPLDQAHFEIADLILICGENNTGKTYLNCATYGFLRLWRAILTFRLLGILDGLIRKESRFVLPLQDFINKYDLIELITDEYQRQIPGVFASRAERFQESVFALELTQHPDPSQGTYERVLRDDSSAPLITLSKPDGDSTLEVIVSKNISRFAIIQYVADAVAEILYGKIFPAVFIASAERTGAAIFRQELDFARTRMIDILSRGNAQELSSNPFKLTEAIEVDYAKPVQDNVNFMRQLEDIEKNTSPLLELHPDLLDSFEDIIGGSYRISKNDGLHFVSRSNKTRLRMNESSSSVRALVDIGFYLKHQAKPGDLLMIDEPELNLHPRNQRKLARLLSRLVNVGLKVFITTHSDYLVKELNTLIMLHARTSHTRQVQEKYKYKDQELLDPTRVRLYITTTELQEQTGRGRRKRINTIKSARITPEYGIEVDTFDQTIDEMNTIQEAILYGAPQ